MRTLWRWLLLLCQWLCRMVRHWLWPEAIPPCWGRIRTGTPVKGFRIHPKPAWVRYEIIRLKALMPAAGCRTLAHLFNRRFAVRRRMTVGKTYVADTVRRHQYAILARRRALKHAIPRPVPRNLIWGMDLMVKTDRQGRQHPIVVILDHASRACLTLHALGGKSTRTVFKLVTETVRRYGRPTYVRTDNEAIFASPVFRLGLWAWGIRHQRTDPGCPWQNGRVERAIGTVKAALVPYPVADQSSLSASLQEVRWWYNHVRPHHHLHGRTPAEVWAGVDVFAAPT